MTRTPLRISLFGGGTDYPEYYERHPGAVVGFTIDKFILISALRLRAYLQYNYRVSYSALEFTDSVDDIRHPVVREALKLFRIGERLDINVMSDLPAAGGGLGSSSAFTVGFVNLIASMLQTPMSRMDLARTAIRIEREILGENVGVQDQLHTAFGGVNRFDFEGNRFRISPVQVRGETLEAINRSLVLIHTGMARRATDTAKEQVAATASRKLDRDLHELYQFVEDGVALLEGRASDVVPELGRRLQEAWKIKRGLSSGISSDGIDELYEKALGAGCLGGKLCGAGGGGFVMMLCPPERLKDLIAAVSPLAVLPTKIDMAGTSLLFSSNEKLEQMPVAANRVAERAVTDSAR